MKTLLIRLSPLVLFFVFGYLSDYTIDSFGALSLLFMVLCVIFGVFALAQLIFILLFVSQHNLIKTYWDIILFNKPYNKPKNKFNPLPKGKQ